MITERVSENQTVSVKESAMSKYHTADDSVYLAERASYSPAYIQHLDMALHDRVVALPEEEYEDQCRYQPASEEQDALTKQEAVETVAGESVATENVEENVPMQMPEKPHFAAEEQSSVRVFNPKRALWLAIYILLALGVVLALIFTLPGTAWERKSITVDKNSMQVAAADEVPAVQEASINTIYTLDGRSISVELETYADEKPETNWFDTMCDWLNNVMGG